MEFTLTDVIDAGDDVLLVRAAVVGRKEPLEVRGWVSALTHHFDADAYGPDGRRREDAQPRAMTAVERRAYCEGLVREVLAISVPIHKRIELDFD